jgi:peptide deformylase
MALLDILEFPDTRLVDDMLETMYKASGIGLAATQVNVHKQVVTIDISDNQSDPHVFVNPTITVLDATLGKYNEGCLSIPGFYEEVKRPQRVRVKALGTEGNSFTIEPEGLLSVCLQHEIDHLNGKLFVDHISLIKRYSIRKKLEKKHRLQT